MSTTENENEVWQISLLLPSSNEIHTSFILQPLMTQYLSEWGQEIITELNDGGGESNKNINRVQVSKFIIGYL